MIYITADSSGPLPPVDACRFFLVDMPLVAPAAQIMVVSTTGTIGYRRRIAVTHSLLWQWAYFDIGYEENVKRVPHPRLEQLDVVVAAAIIREASDVRQGVVLSRWTL